MVLLLFDSKFLPQIAKETCTYFFPFFFLMLTELANLLKDSVKMDGVSLEEINLMIAMSKGLDDNGAGNDLKVFFFDQPLYPATAP